MTEQYPRHQIDDEIEVRTSDQDLRGTITGISYACPVYMYVIQLVNPVEGEFGQQTGLYVPEGILIAKPDVDPLTQLAIVDTYVYVDEDEANGETTAIDVEVLIATEDDVFWYVISRDEMDGKQPVRFSPFNDYNEALEFANNYIQENHAAAPGENAAQYLARIAAEGEDGSHD
jgi:hypothetical protein